MFNEESKSGETKNRDSKKITAQIIESDNHATEDIKFQKDTMEGKCVAGPVLTRAQVKKIDEFHQLKVKEAMSSVDKSTIEDLQKMNFTLKKCFVREGKPIIRENCV